jgi:hypothetical protein
MRNLYINNDGAGFADRVDIPHGTTVQELFERQMRQSKPEKYSYHCKRLRRRRCRRPENHLHSQKESFHAPGDNRLWLFSKRRMRADSPGALL